MAEYIISHGKLTENNKPFYGTNQLVRRLHFN